MTTSIMALTKISRSLFRCAKLSQEKLAHTWSPLATIFNNKPTNALSYKFFDERKGLFDVPELTAPEGFFALRERSEQEANRLIEEAISPNRTRKMVVIFDELSNSLCKVADLAEFIRIAHPDVRFASAAELASAAISSIVEKLNTNSELYAALKKVVETGDIMETTDVDKHVARLFLSDFEQSGIHLPENQRQEVVFLNNAIMQLGQSFVAGSCMPRFVAKEDLSEYVRKMCKTDGENVLMTSLHADSSNFSTREFAYRVYLHPEPHQEYILKSMLECRHVLARMCGFQTYSERAIKGSLAETPETVGVFLNLLSEALRPRANEDFKMLQKAKITDLGAHSGELFPWDIPYYSYRVRRNTFNVVGDIFSPYFSLGACMEGLNYLMQSLFGVTFSNADMSIGECWDPYIYKLAVTHETEGLLGYIYCDFYARDGKQNQDCHFTIRGGRVQADGTYQLPVVVLMLNFPAPRWSSPSLLSPGMVDNLFHEMGHAMHSMLARTQYQHITGTRCCTDFAEVPSILMEYFANDPRVLRKFARHFQTGEPMPEQMLNRLCASKHAFAASEMQLQVFYSALDQRYHGHHPLFGNTTDILAEVQNQYYGVPHVENTAWQLRFSHLVGYGAKYYSYLMSKAVASWIWSKNFERDPFCRKQGELYRRDCLNFGGGKPPRKLVNEFLQREITPSQLVQSLVKETDEKIKKVQSFEL